MIVLIVIVFVSFFVVEVRGRCFTEVRDRAQSSKAAGTIRAVPSSYHSPLNYRGHRPSMAGRLEFVLIV